MRLLLLLTLLTFLVNTTFAQTCDAPSGDDVTICAGSAATLVVTGMVGDYRWYDAISGGRLLGTGTSFTTPPLSSTTNYYVETESENCISSRTLIKAIVRSGPTASGVSICAGSSATLKATAPGGDYEWFDAATGGNLVQSGATFITPILSSNTTYYVQTTVDGCISRRTAVTVTVNAKPDPPVVSDQTVCSGSSATFTASGGGTYQWFSVPNGGNAIIVSPDFTTPALTANTTYYVQTTINGCTSDRIPVNVTVNPLPAAPAVAPVSICAGSTATLSASGGQTYTWYAVPSRGTPVGTGQTFITPVLGRNTTYYVETSAGGCPSVRTAVTVTVNAVPDAPVSAPQTICAGSSANLTASSSQPGTLKWHDAAAGGNLVHTGANFATPALSATTTYYVDNTAGGCISARTPVKVTVTQVAAPTVSNLSICAGSNAILIASGSSGTYEWYDAPAGGNLLISNPVYTTPALNSSTTYYVQASFGGCTSVRVPVSVTVTTAAAIPVSSNTTICSGNQAVLTASSGSGNYEWYNSATGGTMLGSGSSFTTPALTSNTTYYVQSVSNGCASNRLAVTVTIDALPDNAFSYSSHTYCQAGTDPTPALAPGLSGTFTGNLPGIIVNNSTGRIDLAASTLGTYIVTFTSSGTCPLTRTFEVTITDNVNGQFSIAASYCLGGANPYLIYSGGASQGVLTSSSPDLFFTNDGAIDLQSSKAGTYTVTNTIPNTGGACSATSFSQTVTLYASPGADAGADQVLAPNSTVALSGTASNSASYQWTGGSGSFSDPNILNPVYTPALNETSATLTLTATGNAPCAGPAVDAVTILFNLPAPAAADVTICAGSTATLIVASPTGTYEWYDAPVGGTLLISNPAYVTPVLSSNAMYYVQSVIAGVPSPRTAVRVIVNSNAAPVVPAVSICSGSSATLSVTSPTGIYEWYDQAAGGNLIHTGNTFSTSVLRSSATYYVQDVASGCVGPRTAVAVTVKPVPVITSAVASAQCNESLLNYTITADLPGTTFTWSRAAIADISNAPVSNQVSSQITETLVNTSNASVDVVYMITPSLNGCDGTPFEYRVTIDPSPVATSALSGEICNNTAPNYTITYNMPGTNFSWSRAAVPGISNRAVSGQKSATIREILTNTTNAPILVTYTFNQSYQGCASPAFKYVVKVNPIPGITSRNSLTLCNNTPHSYQITSNVAGTTFKWSRAAISGISNRAVVNESSSLIEETLINTSRSPVTVTYTIVPTANGCTGQTFSYRVTVNPTVAPLIVSNSPVCMGSRIALSTTQIAGATYQWAGPNGFRSTFLKPIITNASKLNEGRYSLVVTINGCVTDTAYANIEVTGPPVVSAGSDQTLCANTSSVNLAGTAGGAVTSTVWSSNGSGTFSPSNGALNAKYIPSQKDIAAGNVRLTLTAVSNCGRANSSLNISFAPIPVVKAGVDQEVCVANPSISLQGTISMAQDITWTSSGSGLFSPSSSALNAVYVPSTADLKRGNVVLSISAVENSVCAPLVDQIRVRFIQPAAVSAGPDITVLQGKKVTLNPSVSDKDAEYLWTPNVNLSDNKVKNPVLTAVSDQIYTLQVTNKAGCVTEDKVSVHVMMPISTNNTFTPNGDGVNDVWTVPELNTYPNSTVSIFNRYGDKVYTSVGYNQPWDGTANGQPAPVGTYYYVINTNFEGLTYSGSVTILR